MRRIILLATFIIELLGTVSGQTYYNMWRGSGNAGKPEWIANLSMRTENQVTGIDFTTANSCRGFVNGSGKWGFINPSSTTTPLNFSNIVNNITNLTIGASGWICAEGFSVRELEPGVTTTLDLLSTNQKSTITSNGDNQGLHIRSAIGHKIYLYDKIYFDDKNWASFGPGRNDDPTIDNPNIKMLRIGSSSSIGFWGDGNVNVNDTPNMQLDINGNLIIGQPLNQSQKLNISGAIYTENNGVKTFFGKDEYSDDAWIGTTSNHGLYLATNHGSGLYMDANKHNIYLGMIDTEVAGIRAELKDKYKLFVAKGILSEDYSIAPKSSWSDFVFNKGYKLRNINEVATFISENKHLPDVPSAEQVAKEGYSQHDMNKILLQKIEELTLYTIQQQKEIMALRAELDKIKE